MREKELPLSVFNSQWQQTWAAELECEMKNVLSQGQLVQWTVTVTPATHSSRVEVCHVSRRWQKTLEL